MTPQQRFVQARDFLQQHRLDYDTAVRDYRQPELDQFNWAIDYFDHQARDNQTAALWVELTDLPAYIRMNVTTVGTGSFTPTLHGVQ